MNQQLSQRRKGSGRVGGPAERPGEPRRFRRAGGGGAHKPNCPPGKSGLCVSLGGAGEAGQGGLKPLGSCRQPRPADTCPSWLESRFDVNCHIPLPSASLKFRLLGALAGKSSASW